MIDPPRECEDITTWGARIERAIGGYGGVIDRVVVLAETGSTQDAARRLADGKPGLMVLAGRQTAGRGRLGRSWADTSHLGVAVTFVLPGEAIDDGRLSLMGGIVAKDACGGRPGSLGLRWPNDVVEPRPPHRKVAGVLIERQAGLIYLGIGINVLQRDSDWPAELAPRAASMRGLGIEGTRLDVAGRLVHSLAMHFSWETARLASAWREHDILVGGRHSFAHDNQRYFGTVVDIDPVAAIRVRLGDGREVSLPACTTSLVHEEPRPPHAA